jgi:hypothetical protein
MFKVFIIFLLSLPNLYLMEGQTEKYGIWYYEWNGKALNVVNLNESLRKKISKRIEWNK